MKTIVPKNFYRFPGRLIESHGGFTILEMMVSLAIFSVIIVIAAGGFIRALRTERQVSAYMNVNSSISLFLEQVAREVRTGQDFCVNGNNCASPSDISFLNPSGKRISYCLDRGSIKRSVDSDCGSGQRITGENILVKYLTFVITGNGASDGAPPRVTIILGATSQKQFQLDYELNLQTTVSGRVLGG